MHDGATPETPTDADGAVRTAGDDVLEWLSRFGASLIRERDPDRLIQRVTDELTRMVTAQFGAFFYNVIAENGELYTLYALSGAPREAFEKFPMPRNTAIFGPTFRGEGIVRLDDVTADPRYGKNAPYRGMPEGHLPVRSYLAAPVKGLDGEVLGGLFFGHGEPGRFDAAAERAIGAVTPLVGSALESARLFARLREREAALASSERRHRLVSDAMQEGIWYWDVRANRVEWNDRLLAIMGVRRDDWSGTFDAWAERLHPEDRPRLEQALKDHLERREPYRIELFRLRHEDGAYRWCTTAGQAEWDADGRPLFMAGSFRDVTDRQMAEERLRATELRQAQILDSMQDLIFTKNERLQITWANAAACRYYGATVEELRGITDVPYNAIDFTQQYHRDDREVFERGVVVERAEEPNVARNGEIRTFHTVKTPVRDATGRVIELVGVSRDVTQHKRAADAQRLLAHASAILQGSIDYEITLANVARATVPSFADWVAVDLVESDGKLRRVAVYHPDPAKLALAHELERRYPTDMSSPHGLPEALRTRTVQSMGDIPDEVLVAAARDEEHLRMVRELGLRSFVVAPIVVGGHAMGGISFVSAESGRRYVAADVEFAEELARRAAVAIENARLYREVRELAASLERRVEERTRELTDANRELESFSYTVSHDLRAPVRHISGFVDLLRSSSGDRLDERGRRYLDTIHASAGQMGALIDGLLAFSRLGRAALVKRRVDLAAVVRDVIRELEPELHGRRVAWDIGPLPEVTADPTMIRLVVANLIGNAVKYTRGRPEAHVAVSSARGEHEVVISVADDGVGFKPEYEHKLFGVFQRLHADKEFEGTGIGLATVRRVVHRHGGRTWAESRGRGATFHFSLPLEETTT